MGPSSCRGDRGRNCTPQAPRVIRRQQGPQPRPAHRSAVSATARPAGSLRTLRGSAEPTAGRSLRIPHRVQRSVAGPRGRRDCSTGPPGLSSRGPRGQRLRSFSRIEASLLGPSFPGWVPVLFSRAASVRVFVSSFIRIGLPAPAGVPRVWGTCLPCALLSREPGWASFCPPRPRLTARAARRPPSSPQDAGLQGPLPGEMSRSLSWELGIWSLVRRPDRP